MADAAVGRNRTALLVAGIAAAAATWLATTELPLVVRIWCVILLAAFPALLINQAGELRRSPPLPRVQLYASSIATLWFLALATIAVTRAGGDGLADIAAVPVGWMPAVLWAAGATLAAEALIVIAYASGMQGSQTLWHLLPASARERKVFLLVALTAGICEEVVFRGFLLAAMSTATQSVMIGGLVAAVAFGVVHAYQDVSGVAVAAILGIILTIPVVQTGSLLPSIIAHVAIDIIGGYWLGPVLMRRQSAAAQG